MVGNTLFDESPDRTPARPSIDEVRAAYRAEVEHRQRSAKLLEEDQDIRCPCCDNTEHIYAKPLSGQMLDYLVKLWLYTEEHGLGYHHARAFLGGSHKASSDGTYLVHWGLLECGGRGLYRITRQGRQWLAGELVVPAGVILYRGKALGWYSAKVSPADVGGPRLQAPRNERTSSMTSLDKAQVRLRDVLGRNVRDATVNVEERDGKHLATIKAPGFFRRRVLLDFNLTADVVMLMDPAECIIPGVDGEAAAGRRLLEMLMRNSYAGGRDIYAYLEREPDTRVPRPLHAQPDRVYYYVQPELATDLAFSRAWAEAPATLHKPPAWAAGAWPERATISYKGLEPRCALQLTLWAPSSSTVALEVDVDASSGLRHLLEVIQHRVTGQPDPRVIAQLVTLYRGLPLPFKMKPRI